MRQCKDDSWSDSFFEYEWAMETGGYRHNDFKSIVNWFVSWLHGAGFPILFLEWLVLDAVRQSNSVLGTKLGILEVVA